MRFMSCFLIIFVSLFFSFSVALSLSDDYQPQSQEGQIKWIYDLNKVQLAQIGACPVSMPEMQAVVVFQSVEAPQIESIDEQADVPYDNYDLVSGKPAGILITLDQAGMSRTKEFALAFNIPIEKVMSRMYYPICKNFLFFSCIMVSKTRLKLP